MENKFKIGDEVFIEDQNGIVVDTRELDLLSFPPKSVNMCLVYFPSSKRTCEYKESSLTKRHKPKFEIGQKVFGVWDIRDIQYYTIRKISLNSNNDYLYDFTNGEALTEQHLFGSAKELKDCVSNQMIKAVSNEIYD